MRYERKFILLAFSLALFLLFLIILLAPIENSGYLNGGALNSFWLAISDSGKAAGTIILVISVALIALIRNYKNKQAVWRVVVFAIGFLLVLKGFAEFNEYFLKPYLGVLRPSFENLSQRGIIDLNTFAEEYPTKEARREFLDMQLEKAEVRQVLRDIDPQILQHWLYETGYSLPSGHTQNAFILATVLCYALVRMRHKYLQLLAYLIMSWAVLMGLSRIALGVHTTEDVMLGAFSGGLYALVLIGFGIFDYLIVRPEDTKTQMPDKQLVEQ